jgi:uncharacterized membrane protein
MLPMNKKEFEKWTEVRKAGSNKYSVKTSVGATLLVFVMYVLTNAYIHLDEIDKYIAYNLANALQLFVGLIITVIGLFVVSKVLFKINEKRYSATEEKNK